MTRLRERRYYVYVLTNRSGTLYTGVTNDLMRRVSEHKAGKVDGFTKRYRINRLVYFEDTSDIHAALQREKQIKGWTRLKRVNLVNSINPKWRDLSDDWFEDSQGGLDSLDSSLCSE